MGNSSSKAVSAAKSATGAARRQYPSSPSILNSATSTSHSPSSQSSTQHVTTGPPPPERQLSAQVHPDPQTAPPSDVKSSHIDLDGRDPQFASSLRKLGPAVPVEQAYANTQTFPTSSQPPVGQQGQNIFPPSPSQSGRSSDPSLKIVKARESIAQRFSEESENMGRASFGGRSLISAKEISEVIRSRALGKSDVEIEKQLRLKPGVVREILGIRGLIDNV